MIPFLPLVLNWLRSKENPSRYLTMIEQLKQVNTAIEEHQNSKSPDPVLDRLLLLQSNLEEEIRPPEKTDKNLKDWVLFRYLVAIEGFIVIGSFFSFEKVKKIVNSESYESGIHFFEGIFKYPLVRVGLIVFLFSSALYATYKIKPLLSDHIGHSSLGGILLLGIFNSIFVVIAISVFGLLFLLDPISPLWWTFNIHPALMAWASKQ